MPWSEIEYFSISSFPGTSRAENPPTLEPRNKQRLFRGRNCERFAVHLFMRDFEIRAEPLDDGVARIAYPKALFLSGFAPSQRTGRTKQSLKDLRIMTRMQNNQSHAFENPFLDAIDDLVRNVGMCNMSPPKKHVRLRKRLLGQ